MLFELFTKTHSTNFIQSSKYGSIFVVSVASLLQDFKQYIDLSMRYFMYLTT